jgi:hypothetical protein
VCQTLKAAKPIKHSGMAQARPAGLPPLEVTLLNHGAKPIFVGRTFVLINAAAASFQKHLAGLTAVFENCKMAVTEVSSGNAEDRHGKRSFPHSSNTSRSSHHIIIHGHALFWYMDDMICAKTRVMQLTC